MSPALRFCVSFTLSTGWWRCEESYTQQLRRRLALTSHRNYDFAGFGKHLSILLASVLLDARKTRAPHA